MTLLLVLLGLIYIGVAVWCWRGLPPAERDGRDAVLAAVWPVTLPVVALLMVLRQRRGER